MQTTIDDECAAGIDMVRNQNDLNPDPGTPVFVVFTSMSRTLKAMEKAREIARFVGTNIEVVAVQVVPFPLPLERPPVSLEFIFRRFEAMAAGFPQKFRISTYLCRDPMEAYKRILNRNCLVVIGVKKSWMAGPQERLARKLRRAGYRVVIVKTE
jgi:hypothetical protein